MSLATWEHQWATTPDSAKKNVWRAHRLDEVLAGNTPKALTNDPTVVLHIWSKTAFDDATDLPKIVTSLFAPGAELAPATTRGNADGIAAVSNDDPAYIQIYRDQTIEYASASLLRVPGEKHINSQELGRFLSDFMVNIRRIMNWQEEERTSRLRSCTCEATSCPTRQHGTGLTATQSACRRSRRKNQASLRHNSASSSDKPTARLSNVSLRAPGGRSREGVL